jgi:hypothetical protein
MADIYKDTIPIKEEAFLKLDFPDFIKFMNEIERSGKEITIEFTVSESLDVPLNAVEKIYYHYINKQFKLFGLSDKRNLNKDIIVLTGIMTLILRIMLNDKLEHQIGLLRSFVLNFYDFLVLLLVIIRRCEFDENGKPNQKFVKCLKLMSTPLVGPIFVQPDAKTYDQLFQDDPGKIKNLLESTFVIMGHPGFLDQYTHPEYRKLIENVAINQLPLFYEVLKDNPDKKYEYILMARTLNYNNIGDARIRYVLSASNFYEKHYLCILPDAARLGYIGDVNGGVVLYDTGNALYRKQSVIDYYLDIKKIKVFSISSAEPVHDFSTDAYLSGVKYVDLTAETFSVFVSTCIKNKYIHVISHFKRVINYPANFDFMKPVYAALTEFQKDGSVEKLSKWVNTKSVFWPNAVDTIGLLQEHVNVYLQLFDQKFK